MTKEQKMTEQKILAQHDVCKGCPIEYKDCNLACLDVYLKMVRKAAERMEQKKMTAQNIKFEVGKTYTCRSVYDYDCVFSFEVIARTEKRITIVDSFKRKKTVGVNNLDGVETAYPSGRYSMAPVIRANVETPKTA